MTSDDACGLENRWALAEWQRGKKVPRVVCARSRRDLDLRTTDCTYRTVGTLHADYVPTYSSQPRREKTWYLRAKIQSKRFFEVS